MKKLVSCSTAKSLHTAVENHANARPAAREVPRDREDVTEDGEDEGSDMVFQGDQQGPLRIRAGLTAALAQGTANTARQCCMLAQMKMVDEARRKYALLPYSTKENLVIEGDKGPCDQCIGNQPTKPHCTHLWQGRVIHYAFFWGFCDELLERWSEAPPTLLDDTYSARLQKMSDEEQRMSLMDVYDIQRRWFSVLKRAHSLVKCCVKK